MKVKLINIVKNQHDHYIRKSTIILSEHESKFIPREKEWLYHPALHKVGQHSMVRSIGYEYPNFVEIICDQKVTTEEE